jgi:TonB family protein
MMCQPPNKRVQLTRVLLPAVARSSPLTRRPLGGSKQLAWRVLLLLAAGCSATGECRNPVKPSVIHQEAPVVPAGFWDSHKDGAVHLRVIVGRDGTVIDERILSTAGRDYSILALETVRKWRYNPARCDGFAIDFNIDVTIRFAHE